MLPSRPRLWRVTLLCTYACNRSQSKSPAKPERTLSLPHLPRFFSASLAVFAKTVLPDDLHAAGGIGEVRERDEPDSAWAALLTSGEKLCVRYGDESKCLDEEVYALFHHKQRETRSVVIYAESVVRTSSTRRPESARR